MYFSLFKAANVGPFVDVECRLPSKGVTVVLGEIEGFAGASSNGSGKSHLMDVPALAWYGHAMNGDAFNAVVRNGEKSAMVASELSDDDTGGGGVVWRVERYYNHKEHGSTVRLWVEGEERTLGTPKLTQALIDSMIGDFDAFTSTAALGAAADATNFYTMSDKAKKRLMERVFGLEWCSDALKDAKRALDALEASESALKQEADGYESATIDANARADDYRSELKESSYAQRIKDAKASLAEMTARSDALAEAVVKAQKRYDNAKADGQEIAEYEGAIREQAREVAEAESLIRSSQLVKERSLAAQKRLRAEVEALGDSKPGKCPTCKRPMSADAHGLHVAAEIAKRVAEAKSLGFEMDKADMQIGRSTIELNEARSAKHARPDVADPAERKQQLRQAKEAASNHVDAMAALADGLATMRSARDRLKQRIERATADADAAEAQRKKVVARLHDLEDALAVKRFAVEGFGDGGIKAFVLEGYLPVIGAKATAYARRLFGADVVVKVNPTTRLKSDEDRERISVDVSIPGCASNYRRASKAQRQRLSLAIVLAIRDVVERYRPTPVRHVLIDELLDGMDDVGVDVVGELLREVGRERPVLVVSHVERLQAKADHVVRVRHNGRYATVE